MRPWEFLYDIFLFANNACRIILVSASSYVLNNSGTSFIEPALMVITVSGFWKHPAEEVSDG
jgi:hypothetical protein